MVRMTCWWLMAAALCAARSGLADQPSSGAAEVAAEKEVARFHAAEETAKADSPATPAAHETSSAAGEHGHGQAADHADGHAGEHAGGHHDPYDLSHANAGPKLNDPDEFKYDLAIWTLVVFLVLMGVLMKFAWTPIMKGLESREKAIADMIEEAKQNQAKAAASLAAYEARLAAAGEETRELIAQARKDAEAVGARLVGEAQTAAQRERQRAIEDIQAAKTTALQEMAQQSVDIAVSLASRIVRRQLSQEDRSQLVRDALEQLPSRN